MPSYRLTSPEGKKYKVTVPEGTPQEEIYAYINSLGQSQEAAPTQREALKDFSPEAQSRLNKQMDETKRFGAQRATDIASAVAGGLPDLVALPGNLAMRIPGALTYGAGVLSDSPKLKEAGKAALNALPEMGYVTGKVHKGIESLAPELLTPKTDEEKAWSTGTQIAASAFSPNAYARLIKSAPEATSLGGKFMKLAATPTKGTAQALSAVGAATGAGAGEKYFPDNPLAQFGLTLAGGLVPAAGQAVAYGTKRAIGNLTDASPEMYRQNIRAELPPGVTDVDEYIKNTPVKDLPSMALSDISDSNRHQSLYNILGSGFLGRGIERSGEAATKRLTDKMRTLGFNPAMESTQVGNAVQPVLKDALMQETTLTEGLNKAPFGALGVDTAVTPTQAGRAGITGLKSSLNELTNIAEAAERQGAAELAGTQLNITDIAHKIMGIPGQTNFEGIVAAPLRDAAAKVPAVAKVMDILEQAKVKNEATGEVKYLIDIPTFYRTKQALGEYMDGLKSEPTFGSGATKSTMGAWKEGEKIIEGKSPAMAARNKAFYRAGEVRRGMLEPITKGTYQIGDEAIALDVTERGTGNKLINMATKEPEKLQAVLSEIKNPLRQQTITNATHTSLGGGEGQFNPVKWAEEFNALPSESKALLGGKAAKEAADQILERAAKLEATGKQVSHLTGAKSVEEAGRRVTGDILSDPSLYQSYAKMLPPDVQEAVRQGAINKMGGGTEQFNLVKFADSYFDNDKITNATRKLIAGNDPEVMKNQRIVAQAIKNRKETVGFAGKKETSLMNRQLDFWGLLKGFAGTGGLGATSLITTGSFSRLMTDPQALKIMAKMSKMSENVKTPASAALVQEFNQIIDKYRTEESLPEQKSDAGSDTLSGGETQQEIKGGALDDIIKKYGFKHKEPKKAPANAKIIKGMIKSESGGDPNAKNPVSTASGILQYTTDTWKSAVNLHKDLGFTEKDKDNPKAQIAMTHRLIEREYKPALTKAKIPVTPGTIYAMHHFGQGNAVNFLKNKNSYKAAYKMFPKKVVEDNQNVFFEKGKPRSARGVYSWLQKRVH